MLKDTKITSKLTSILLVVALLFSFSSEALHIFSHSDFNHCTETGTTHIHQLNAECDVFDFHNTSVLSLSSHSVQPQIITNFKTIFPPVEAKFFFTATFHISLRGPPKSV